MPSIIRPDPLAEPAKRIAEIAADYHGDSGTAVTQDRVLRWAQCFPEPHRLAVLNETAHVLSKTYISQARMATFLSGLARSESLTKGDPNRFWSSTEILTIQQRGSSQKEMVALLQGELTKAGITTRQPGQPGSISASTWSRATITARA